VQWRSPAVSGDAPAPREFHTLTSLTKGRLMMFGGDHMLACCLLTKVILLDQILQSGSRGTGGHTVAILHDQP